MSINNSHKNVASWILRILILGVCGWVIWSTVSHRWSFDFQFTNKQLGLILIVITLMPINWRLEIWRWKVSLDSIELTSWREASRQVFSGLALNWILPFTSGDLIARLSPNADRKKVGVLILYNRGVMLALTLILGIYGIYTFSQTLFQSYKEVLSVGLILTFLTIVAIGTWTKPILSHTWGWLFPVTVISMFRYLIFTIQFLLLFYAFMPEVSLAVIFAGVGWTFFFRSVIPSLFGNLGVREVGALVFFESYVTDPSLILIPSLLIWLINTVGPSVLGLYYLVKSR